MQELYVFWDELTNGARFFIRVLHIQPEARRELWSHESFFLLFFSVTLFWQQVALLYHLARSKWHQTIVADWNNGQALTSVKMFSIQTLKNNQTKSSTCKTTIMGTFKTTSIQLSSHPYKGQIRMQLGCYPDDISAPLNLQHLIPM